MTPSTKWVNPELKAYPRRSRTRRRRNGYHATQKENRNRLKPSKNTHTSEKVNRELTSQRNQGQPSLLETLSTMSTLTQKVDWEQVRHKMEEINQVVEQLSGVFQQLNRWNHSPAYRHQQKEHPYYAQHPYTSHYPYDPYRQGQ